MKRKKGEGKNGDGSIFYVGSVPRTDRLGNGPYKMVTGGPFGKRSLQNGDRWTAWETVPTKW